MSDGGQARGIEAIIELFTGSLERSMCQDDSLAVHERYICIFVLDL